MVLFALLFGVLVMLFVTLTHSGTNVERHEHVYIDGSEIVPTTTTTTEPKPWV